MKKLIDGWIVFFSALIITLLLGDIYRANEIFGSVILLILFSIALITSMIELTHDR